jgi:multidrug efflux pump subunit AcrB
VIGPNLSAWAIKRKSLIVCFMLAALIAGALAFLQLGRNEDPAFTFRTMVVQAAWPGATIDDTLTQVTERIERKIQEVDALDYVESYTQAGVTTIFVHLRGDTSPEVVPDYWYDVRKKIGDIRHTLPPGIVGPGFNDDFGDVFGIIYGFTADGFTQRELRDHVEDVRSRLLLVPDVAKIEILGAQDEQVFLKFSLDRLAALGLDFPSLIAQLQAQNVVRPAGTVETGQERVSLRVTGAFESEEDIRAINFNVGGRVVRLTDIADVVRGFADPPQPMFRVNGEPAIGLAIAMQPAGDILALGRNLQQAMAEITAGLPLGIEPHLVADQAVTVDTAIGEFTTSLWQAIVIIIVVSFVSLGIRPGMIVALSIPLTLAIVFVMMQNFGIDLQRISLGALIIALTLLVDDAMTTIDAMIRRLAAGDTAERAATFAYSTLAAPMLTGTLVTIAGFVPIGFAKSTAGEYTFSIFAVVGIALVVSWLVAVLFAPPLGIAILRAPKQTASSDQPGRVLNAYRGLLLLAIRLRWLTIAVTIALFVVSIFLLRFVPQQFFPSSDRPELLVDLTLPHGSSIYASRDAVATIEGVLRADEDVLRWSSYVGRGAIRFYLPLDVQLANPFFSQLVVIARDVEARERLQAKLEKLLAEEFPQAIGNVSPLELGPPVGWPVQYRVSGPDIEQVRSIARRVAQAVATSPAAQRINFDWMDPTRQVRIEIDQDEARRVGVTSASIAAVLNAAMTGQVVAQLRDDIYLIDVRARAVDSERLSFENLRTLQVPVAGGRSVALSQFARIVYDQEQPLVWRRDRVPTLTVLAAVAPGTMPEAVVAELAAPIAELRAGLPRGYSIELGGIAEESAASRASVFAVIPLMLLIMLTALMFHLQSFVRLFMVIGVVPLGLIGIVAALLLSGRPLGFVAILGCLALMGMIAKNAVILITQIDEERAAGKNVHDAVIAASSSRFRPLMLTALSTVLWQHLYAVHLALLAACGTALAAFLWPSDDAQTIRRGDRLARDTAP